MDRRIQNFAKVLEDRLHRKVDDHVALASQVNSCNYVATLSSPKCSILNLRGKEYCSQIQLMSCIEIMCKPLIFGNGCAGKSYGGG